MPHLITSAERIVQARDLIQKARDYPVPPGAGKYDLSYIAQVRNLLRQAKDLVKFIPNQPSATPEMKADVKKIYEEAEQAGRDIFRG